MTAWLLANMAWASLFMLLVLIIRKPFAHLLGAGAAYALWLVPALRLAMPPLPGFAPDLPPIAAAETLVIWTGDVAAPLPPDLGPGQWAPWLLALWAGGAAVLLAWQWLSYRRFLTELSLSSRSVGAHRGLPLVESAAVQGPVALGLLDRRIVVPADFAARYSPEERSLALDHEAIHHRRGDIWWNHLGLLILALNWFNPVAWLAFRAFRADQELACDARVTAAASPDTRHDYARALVKSASRPGLIAACPLNHADQLKRRLKMMKDHKSSRARMLAGAAAVAALAGLGLALGTPGFAQPEAQAPQKAQPREERREERTIIRTYRHDAGDAEHREHGAHGEDGGDRQRVIVMTHRGDGPHGGADVRVQGPHGDVMAADCQDAPTTDVDETTDGQRTRIVLCSRGNATPAERLERLQRVRDRLANDSELSEAQRAHVTEALDREIARLRGN
jgi:beta-lactamase regulating signal transducer with metallopeptidase domain